MTLGQKIVDGLQRFLIRLRSGEDIPVTTVRQSKTPDGSMHEFKDLVWTTGPDGKPMRRPESVPDPNDPDNPY